jgi:hypothetical protein
MEQDTMPLITRIKFRTSLEGHIGVAGFGIYVTEKY